MPIYEYECDACKAVFERLQKLSDPDPEQCPKCGKQHVRRRLSAPTFRLVGSGWYETDFKGKGEQHHNLASKDEAPSASGAQDQGEVAKPEPAKASTATTAADT